MEFVDHEERTAELLDELGECHAEGLLHLFDCQVCQGAARPRLGGEPDAARRAAGRIYERERLLASAVEQRAARAGGPGYRNLRLADLLLDESWCLQPVELALSEEMARLAFRVAAQVYPAECAGRVDGVKTRASVLVGNARRLAVQKPATKPSATSTPYQWRVRLPS